MRPGIALLDALEQLVHVDQVYGWGSLTALATLSYASGGDARILAHWLERFCREAPTAEAPYDLMEEAAKAWVRATDPFARPADIIALVRTRPCSTHTWPRTWSPPRRCCSARRPGCSTSPAVAAVRLARAVDIMRAHAVAGTADPDPGRAGARCTSTSARTTRPTTSVACSVDIADAEQLTYTGDNGRELRARVAGVRGDVELVRRLSGEVLLDLDVGECVALECNVRVALGYVHFSQHDAAGCFEQLRGLFRPDGSRCTPTSPTGHWPTRGCRGARRPG